MLLKPAKNTRWIVSPKTALAVSLVLAAGLMLAPKPLTQWLRDSWRETLLPGQRALQFAANAVDRQNTSATGGEFKAADAKAQIAQLNDEIQQLRLALLVTQSIQVDSRNETVLSGDDRGNCPANSPMPPLLLSQTIPARVLGRQAKAFLQAREILDVGRSRGVAADAIVVDSDRRLFVNKSTKIDPQQTGSAQDAAILDQGRDGELQSGRFVLAGRRVWGKLAEVGRHTSTVQRATDAGYRDLVQVASLSEGKLRFQARGVVVGQGQPLCKIENIETSEPIAAGDLVFTADDGVLDVPLLYGRVVRLERKPGAAHWEIWMEPSVPVNSPPAQVAVLSMDLNPARLASGQRP